MVHVLSLDIWNTFSSICLSNSESHEKLCLLSIFNILICPMISSHLHLLIEEAQWYELNGNCSQNRTCQRKFSACWNAQICIPGVSSWKHLCYVHSLTVSYTFTINKISLPLRFYMQARFVSKFWIQYIQEK